MNILDRDGKFIQSLKRNSDQVKQDRMIAIAEDTELVYKRRVEDMQLEVKRLERLMENSIDFSPKDLNSLVPAKDNNAYDFVENDLEAAVALASLKDQLEVAKSRYTELFGELPE